MVSAAMAWIRAQRPTLAPDVAAQAVRLTARDVGAKGYDKLTGFGILNVGSALAVDRAKLPIHDPLEPNDNVSWVDGRAFGGVPAEAVWSGGRPKRLNALLDREEDPVDVYRIVIGAGRSAKVSVIPRFGDPALGVFNSSAFSINDVQARIATSRRAGARKTERVTVSNRGTRSHTYFAVVEPQGNSAFQEREYTLRVG